MCKVLFVDLDGTVARFHEHTDFQTAMYKQGFFLNLRPYESVIEGLRLFHESTRDTEIAVLSAYPKTALHAKKEKELWVQHYLPFIKTDMVFVDEVGVPKSKRMQKGDPQILLDDYTDNLQEWVKAGGHGIKCCNEINHRRQNQNPWVGATVFYQDTPARIAYWLKEYCEIAGKQRR